MLGKEKIWVGNVKAFVLAPWKDVVAYLLFGGLLSACVHDRTKFNTEENDTSLGLFIENVLTRAQLAQNLW